MAALSGCLLLWFLWVWEGAWLPGNGRGTKTKGAGMRESFGAGVSVGRGRWGGDIERMRNRPRQTLRTEWGKRQREGGTGGQSREGEGEAERDTTHRKRLREAETLKPRKRHHT